MLCQTCSAYNDDDREFCFRCQNKLLVLSGVTAFEEDEIDDYEEQEDLSLDEHLLERVSGLEEIDSPPKFRGPTRDSLAFPGAYEDMRVMLAARSGALVAKRTMRDLATKTQEAGK